MSQSKSKAWPKVSVRISTFNQADFIRDTIESVLSQQYPNLEIVIADDCSTDSTRQIITEYQERFPSLIVSVFNDTNLGISGNYNQALFRCTGELIALLDGDDLFLPGKLHAQAEQFMNHPEVVLSYHAADVFSSATNQTVYVANQSKKELRRDVYDIIEKIGIPGGSCVMVRKSACPEHGYDSRLPVVCDWMFYIEVAFRGKIAILDGIYSRYRMHSGCTTNQSVDDLPALRDDTLRTLDLLCQRYPSEARLVRACNIARARYARCLAGDVAAKLISRQSQRANELCSKMLACNKGLSLWVLKYMVQLAAINSTTEFTMSQLMRALRYLVRAVRYQ